VAFGGRVLRLGAPAREAPAVERTDSA
jgi:hypothetical protein